MSDVIFSSGSFDTMGGVSPIDTVNADGLSSTVVNDPTPRVTPLPEMQANDPLKNMNRMVI
jgi:hypothetical protein